MQTEQTRSQSTISSTKAESGQAGASATSASLRGLDYAAQTALLSPDAQGSRVTGTDAPVLVSQLGEPPWKVKSTKEAQTLDTMHVVSHESSGAGLPASYTTSNPRNLAHRQVARGLNAGGWPVALDAYNGVYEVGYEDQITDRYDLWVVDYKAPRQKSKDENISGQLLNEGGGVSVPYVAYRSQQALYSVFTFFCPGDNLVQAGVGATTGRNLGDPYGEDFGAIDQTWGDVGLQVVMGAAEAFGAKGFKEMSAGAQVATVLVAALDNDAVVGTMRDLGLITRDQEKWTRAAVKLVGLMPSFMKMRGGDALDLGDYLGSLATIAGAADRVQAAKMDDAEYEAWYQQNKTVVDVVMNHDKIAAVIQALGTLGK